MVFYLGTWFNTFVKCLIIYGVKLYYLNQTEQKY